MVYYHLEMKPCEEKQRHVKSFICIYKHVCVPVHKCIHITNIMRFNADISMSGSVKRRVIINISNMMGSVFEEIIYSRKSVIYTILCDSGEYCFTDMCCFVKLFVVYTAFRL